MGLSGWSISVNPIANGRGGKSYHGGPSKRNGRHSVAADMSGTAPLTLRDQEKVSFHHPFGRTVLNHQQLNAARTEVFNLQLENHFLKERLNNMAPDHIEGALKENIKLKLEILNISKEMKKLKKILTQQDKDLAEAQSERERRGPESTAREIEEMYHAEKDRRKALERRVEEDEEVRLGLEEEVERLRGMADDQAEEVERLRDAADRAEEELEQIRRAGRGGDPEELEEVSRVSRMIGADL